MEPYIARLSADLSTADNFILRNPPISLEFFPLPEPRLPASQRNESTNTYLCSTLSDNLRFSSYLSPQIVHPDPGTPFSTDKL